MTADSITQSQEGGGTSKLTSAQLLLRYPTLLVHGTPSAWLSRSELVSMASNPDYSASDDTSSSLGDSNYDFVDDKSGIASDDEDHENLTHSVSSNEEREPPQLDALSPQNIWGRLPAFSNTSLAPDYVLGGPRPSPSFSDPINEAHLLPAASTGTIRGPHTGDETNRGLFGGHGDGTEHIIVLEEPSATSMDPEKPFESEYTLKVFGEDESWKITSRHIRATPSRTLTAVIKQTMIKQSLIPQNPYKLLFVGDSAAREEIVWKVGSALDASSIDAEYTPNQYAVVRIPSFENPTAGGVELIDSTGISLIVEECCSATSTKMDGVHETISMNVSHQGSSDRKLVDSVWSGVEHRVTDNWRLPNLAILYCSDSDDTPAKQARFLARKFMDRYQVPYIVISQAPLWDSPRPAETTVMAPEYTTPHICHMTHDSSTSIVKRFPVDLDTFMNLDASQMNRNLAYLATKHASSNPQAPISSQETSSDPPVSKKDYFSCKISHAEKFSLFKYLTQFMRIFLPILFLILGILLYQTFISIAFVAPHVPAYQQKGMNVMTNIQRACPKFGIALPISVQSNPASMTSPVPLLSNKASDSRGGSHLASNLALTSFLHSRPAFASNQSENFEAGIIGDCHIVLRSPGWFRRSRKAHKLAFNVTRSGSVLHHQVSMPFDGVYALEIPKEDAYGTVNVSIWTTSKPIINEKFEVDFGTSWLKASTWNKAAQTISNSLNKNRDTLVASIMVPYHRFTMNLGNLVPWSSKAADEARKGAGKSHTASSNQTTTSAGIVQAMAVDFSNKLLLKLGNGSNAASKVMIHQAQQLYKEIAGYSYNRTLLLLEESQRLPQAITGNLQKIAHDVARLQNTHMRTTQKEALKFWWRIRGLPKRERVEDIKRDESYMRIGKFMKKIGR